MRDERDVRCPVQYAQLRARVKGFDSMRRFDWDERVARAMNHSKGARQRPYMSLESCFPKDIQSCAQNPRVGSRTCIEALQQHA